MIVEKIMEFDKKKIVYFPIHSKNFPSFPITHCVHLNRLNPFPHTTNLQQTTLKIILAKLWEIPINKGTINKNSWKHCLSAFKSQLQQRRQKASICKKGLNNYVGSIMKSLQRRCQCSVPSEPSLHACAYGFHFTSLSFISIYIRKEFTSLSH